MRDVYVIIPVFNEIANLPNLLDSCREFVHNMEAKAVRFVFVDDGSTDGTADWIGSASLDTPGELEVISVKNNTGPGYAFQRGFRSLNGRVCDSDIVVTMEGDNTSSLHVLYLMIMRIDLEGVDVALASPYSYGGGFSNTSRIRELISFFANSLTRIVLGIRGLHTYSSFFRVYTGRTIQRLQAIHGPEIIKSTGFECMVELLKKLVDLRVSISEVPSNLDSSKSRGKSKMRIFRTVKGYVRLFSTELLRPMGRK